MAKTFEDFQRAFPGLYSHGHMIGFTLPPGWTDLVWLLSEQLEPLGVRAVQVKEKFGGLRFYTDLGTHDAGALVRTAEAVSGTICQECGKAGSLAKRGHLILTCCDEHLEGGTRMRENPSGFEPIPPAKSPAGSGNPESSG